MDSWNYLKLMRQLRIHTTAVCMMKGESIDVVYIDGESYLPDGPPHTKEDLKNALLERYSDKNKGS
ncbi:MAG: hypothetical protein O6945_02325 [Gammaproteobacteria bacterium]|nr:hypothetical protein [Gammaproteobacteria bacterium]